MSELSARDVPRRKRRADAERSRAAVLQAAARLLGDRPDAGLEAVAAAAGVSRQTLYVHFASRVELLAAVLDHATAEVLAALDDLGLDECPAAEALMRLIELSWQIVDRYPVLLRPELFDGSGDDERHRPVVARLRDIVLRGQKAGEFDPGLAPEWLAAAIVALGHAAGAEVGAGRMTAEAARAALRDSLLRLCRKER